MIELGTLQGWGAWLPSSGLTLWASGWQVFLSRTLLIFWAHSGSGDWPALGELGQSQGENGQLTSASLTHHLSSANGHVLVETAEGQEQE